MKLCAKLKHKNGLLSASKGNFYFSLSQMSCECPVSDSFEVVVAHFACDDPSTMIVFILSVSLYIIRLPCKNHILYSSQSHL